VVAKKPSKPTHVDVTKLNTVLETLQGLQSDMSNPRPGTWDAVQGDLAADLKQGDGTDATGIQGDLATGIGDAYKDNVYWIGRARTDIQNGLSTVISMLQTTISQHSGADSEVQQGANKTNTSQQAATRG